MNKTYRSVYNASTGTWVAAPETAKGRAKASRRIVASVLSIVAGVATQCAFAFQPIGDNANGSSSDLVIGDNAAGITVPTYFYPTMTTDPWGSPLPGAGSAIVGNNANANQNAGVTLFGTNTSASGNGAVAIGADTSAALDGTAVGTAAFAIGNYSVAMGRGAVASHTSSVAVGVLSTAAGDESLALGDYAFASGTSSVAVGDGAKSTNTEAIAVGKAAQALGIRSISIGARNIVTGDSSGAIGDPNNITGAGSYALGNDNTVNADNAFVVGNNVSVPAGLNGAVVLGNNSTVSAATPAAGMTVNGVAHTFAGGAPAGGDVVSVGSVAAPRQIQNVAAGQVSAASTDAINGSQLYAVSQELDKPLSFSGNSGGNVDRHLGDMLAITGAATTTGTYSGTNLRTVTDPASGSISLQMADAPKFGNVTINDGGSGKITGMTAGTAATDAVNVSQLQAATADAVMYDDSTHNSVTLGGDTYNSVTRTGGTKIVNVARGVNDSDAVNMSQLNETNQAVTNLGDTVNNFAGDESTTNTTINGRGIRYVRTNDTGLPVADAYAQGKGSTAVGYQATATGADALALGHNAAATAANSVAIGANSSTAADLSAAAYNPNSTYTLAGTAPAGEVSVGSAGAERRVTNLAAGAADTDAVNVSQLKSLDSKITASDAGSVKYDINSDGTVNYNSITLAGDTYNAVTKTGGTKIVNVARGVDDSDAVNMSQLNETNAIINNFAGDQSDTYIDHNGRGIRYVRTNDSGLPLDDAHAQGIGSSALGYNAVALGGNALALGRNAVAGNDSDVALGAGSVTQAAVATTGMTIAGKDYTFAGAAPTSTVSVGDIGAERTITNVAAGRVSATSTDAINGSQLYATNQAIEDLDQGAVKYDRYADGTVNYNSVTMGGSTYNAVTKTGGTKITNVARGVADSDAVNVSQLNEVKADVTTIINTVENFAGDQSTTYTEENGHGIRYVRTNDTGLPQADAHARGQASTAVGYNAQATGDSAVAMGRDSNAAATDAVAIGHNSVAANAGDVALGSGSVTTAAVATTGVTIAGKDYTFAGTAPTSTVSVGDVGAERTITNVAAGRISADSTDAINGSQLAATNAAIDQISTNFSNLDQGAVKYDTNADGTVNYNSVTMGGDTYNLVTRTGGTKITNVARGVNDSDAVNMSQLNETNAVINNFAGDQSTEYTEQNGRGIRYVRTNDTGLAQADAYAQGQGSTAVGYDAKATGDSALALGRNAVASDANSVALGAGSVTAAAVATSSGVVGGTTYQFAGGSPTSTVSVGSAGNERTVSNVAAGRISAESTDAVNGSQLYATNQKVDENTQDIANLNQQVGGNTQSITNLNNRVDGVQRDANAGTASAMALAGLPQAVLPGKGMVALAGSTYSGQSALALGVSKLSDSGKWVFKGGVTTNSRRNVGATVGAGFHW